MSEIIRANQVLPDDFAATLRQMYASIRGVREPSDANSRFDALLKTARDAGWSLTALAAPLGITREAVRRRIGRATRVDELMLVPVPPRRAVQEPPPLVESPKLPAAEIVDLRRMQAIARTVNGGTPVDSPLRRVSEQYSARLAAHVHSGFSVYYLARAIGVGTGAIFLRLARHGYRTPPPSIVGTSAAVYRNRKVGDVTRDTCGRGHEMSGDNLRVYPSGTACKACERIRYQEKKQRAAA